MSAKAERIEELMTKAHAALKRAEWFEAERLTAAALGISVKTLYNRLKEYQVLTTSPPFG